MKKLKVTQNNNFFVKKKRRKPLLTLNAERDNKVVLTVSQQGDLLVKAKGKWINLTNA